MIEPITFDVVIVGAGIAGSACARFLADGGLRVALVDRRSAEKAGARWVNGVPSSVFPEVGLPLPKPPELRGQGGAFVLGAPSGAHRVVLDGHDAASGDNPLLELDMRKLGERLRDDAARAKVPATLLFETEVTEVEIVRGRVVAVRTTGGGREPRVLRAPLFIDATGLPAVLRRAVFPHWPAVAPEHLCLAAQYVHRIVDEAGAGSYLRKQKIGDGDVLACSGLRGGFSILNVRVDRDVKEVSLLAGCIPTPQTRGISGARMIDEFRAENPWVGEPIFGGAAAIPLRRPYTRLVAPGLALLGDTACQMFSAHGSGIAIGIRAARMLADVVLASPAARAGDESALHAYAARFHRTHGGLLAGYDAVRRASQALSNEQVEGLFTSGLVTQDTLRAAMAQVLPTPSVAAAIAMAGALRKNPRLTAQVGAAFARVPLLVAHARTYPERFDLKALRAFENRTARLMRETADRVE